MDIKKKREILIAVILLIGILLPVLMLPWTCFDNRNNMLEFINYGMCFTAIKLSGLIQSPRISLLVFYFSHIITFLLVGGLFAILIYPKKTIRNRLGVDYICFIKIKKKIRKVALAVIILLITILTCLYISHKRPLYETKEYSVTANTVEKSYKATVYKMLFRPNILFLHTEKIEKLIFQWFVIDTKNKIIGIPNGPRRQPYLCYNADMQLGIPIDSMKINDGWKSSWEKNVIRFSNKKITITVIKGNKEKIDEIIVAEKEKASKAFKNGDYSTAEFHLTTILCLKPDFAECWVGLAMCLAKQEKNDEAKRAFEKALSIHQMRYKQSPKDYNELWQQVIVLIFLNRKSEAEKILKIGINKFPDRQEFKEPIKKLIDVRAFLNKGIKI